ncbi:MAG: MBL fold metallo-hydrolase [Bacteroidota bacterium]
MLKVESLTFNPFSENTILLYDDETREAFVIDPGCSMASEEIHLRKSIEQLDLKPIRLLNTHCHIDHVFGNAYVSEQYELELGIPELELPLLENTSTQAAMFGMADMRPSPKPGYFLEAGTSLTLGKYQIDMLFCPGHSPGHICFYNAQEHILVGGDVLFAGSIGRADLPGGDMDTLLQSIKRELLVLPDHTVVYPGHGPSTTIGRERISNPFLLGMR